MNQSCMSAGPDLVDIEDSALIDSLSERESQVILFASKGFTDEAIGQQLGISKATVCTYWERVRIKFNLVSRTEITFRYGAITRDRKEQSKNEAQKMMELAATANPVGIFLTDTAGLPVFLNKAFTVIVGMDEEQIKRESPSAIIFPLDRPDPDVWRLHCTEGSEFVSEHNILRKNGTLVLARLHSKEYRAHDQGCGRVGTLEDISSVAASD